MKNDFSAPAFAWIMLTVICLSFLLAGLKAALKRTVWEQGRQQKVFAAATITIVAWTAILLILSKVGFFADFSKLPPRPALAVLIPLPFILGFAFSKTGTQLLKVVPSHWIIFMQSFRIAVELLLLVAFLNDKLPVQMTFEGRNFDVVTGVLALPVGYLLARRKTHSRKLVLVYNIAGLLLLLNILVIAVLSMPTSIRYYMNEPANILVAEFPFILLPGVLVPIAYGLHILSLRQLFLSQNNANI